MIIGFVIWSIVSLIAAGVGIWAWRSDKAVGFYSGVKPPEVDDIRAYNPSVAILWFAYAVLFELLGLPFLLEKQNSAGFVWTVLGVVSISVLLMIVYNRILEKHRVKQK